MTDDWKEELLIETAEERERSPRLISFERWHPFDECAGWPCWGGWKWEVEEYRGTPNRSVRIFRTNAEGEGLFELIAGAYVQGKGTLQFRLPRQRNVAIASVCLRFHARSALR